MENIKMSEERCEVTIRIDRKLSGALDAHNKQRIFKVHQKLRSQNGEAYEPQMFSIGPYHRGKINLVEPEAYKLRYLCDHLARKSGAGNHVGELSVGNYIQALKKHEKEARSYYSEEDTIGLNGDEFIEMLCVDGCFIVEFLRRFGATRSAKESDYSPKEGDPIFRKDWVIGCLIRDLILFENQLPFFILAELFEMTKLPTSQEESLIKLVMFAFSPLLPGENQESLASSATDDDDDNVEIIHFLDLIHKKWCSAFAVKINDENDQGEGENAGLLGKLEHIKSASELRSTGIKFEKASTETSWLDITYQNGIIKIPSLCVHDWTECVFRNLIAYELYILQPMDRKYVVDYITFMDCLIDSSKDVEMLRHRQIISRWLGDDEAISSVINKLGNEVSINDYQFCYRRVFKQVNEYSSRRWNVWRAHLMTNYFNNPWSIISFVAALLLLLLTITQTVFSIVDHAK